MNMLISSTLQLFSATQYNPLKMKGVGKEGTRLLGVAIYNNETSITHKFK